MAGSKKSGNDYFGLSKLISVILAIFFIGVILGIVTRISQGQIIAAILRFFFGWNIILIFDIICLILSGKIFGISVGKTALF